MKKAAWIIDYDMYEDKTYQRPGCPDCNAPMGEKEDGKYYCFSCGQELSVEDEKMLAWYEEMSELHIEYEDCLWCDGKKSVKLWQRRNPVSKKWQTAHGECSICGTSFIV